MTTPLNTPRFRWYRGFRTVANPKTFVQTVSECIQRNNLSEYVPVLRLEKRARGEFYFFVGIDSDYKGLVPEQVQEFLFELPPFRSPVGEEPFELDDIRSMVSGELDVQEYGTRIAYNRLESGPIDDPFNLQDAGELRSDPATGKAIDRLLVWASATGVGSWEVVRQAGRLLGLEPEAGAVRRLVRGLRLLGHLEFSGDGQRWSAAPSVLVQITPAGGPSEFALCGSRDSALLKRLAETGELSLDPQPAGSTRVRWRPGEGAAPLPTSRSSELLARALPDLRGWMASLPALVGLEPGAHRFKAYDGRGFSDATFNGQAGFFQVFARGIKASASEIRPRYTVFHDPERGFLQGDWYGLRFLTLSGERALSGARLDPAGRRLALPTEERWPEIYERALVLASGLLPTQRGGWLIYESIDPPVARLLGEKLGLPILENVLE